MNKKGLLIIGAGGVSTVATLKCAMNIDTFENITLASRTLSKCVKIKKMIKEKIDVDIDVAIVDADDTNDIIKIIKKTNCKVVLNVALPYQDLTIMDACSATNTHYIDTANYEHPDEAKFEYKEQWARNDDFKNNNLTALLGSGFDPGVTGVFVKYIEQNYLDSIEYIDIMDCNAGDHGYPFATNFNPEINLREVSANGRYWEEGEWITTKPLEIRVDHDYPEVGVKPSYLLYHEELESLSKNIKGLKRIRFFMTFGDAYIQHMNCLENVGMLGIEPVEHKGQMITPIEFLATLLPDPASLGPRTHGKTNIGCICEGIKDGVRKKYYIYNICDHQECYKETTAQAVSYTTGVPAMIGSKLVYNGTWDLRGAVNVEEFDSTPFVNEMMTQGLPWKVMEMDIE
ncbi:MAG: saccharopine dehydrogenase family protein [Campylobacteraceae bacterium]|jgi:saccharopine dehydrogenase (NAD+, L-lysine-forming)|nr:saccharopine dehydrogenase family protein [Campylobacteraceae bacterium]MBT4030504.1 saccharopine dehydrogenase family protein [Campylobacteraceae bacterium]MBT4179437.1 saccharopine dehydrogenase family protein [Campylobacteraceae bacterium]MBT4572924.1 saccharopine dehydrogenase family protein [Campylobacteraceae bacterium]MBT4707236.1 saccharopine dehydrogenase family protein [Campylobacteraceae bacterium]